MTRRPSTSRQLPPERRRTTALLASGASRLVGLGGLVVLAALLADQRGVLVPLAASRPWLAGVVAVSGLALALVLRQGRTVLAMLLLAALYEWRTGGSPGASLQLLATSICLLIALLPLVSEHRPWGRRGALWIGGLAGLGGVAWLADPLQPATPAVALAWLERLPVPLSTDPQAVAAPLLLAGGVALLLLLGHRDAPRRAAFWSIVALIGAFGGAPAGVLWIVVAALVWLASSVEAAYALSFLDSLTRLPSRRALERELGELGRTFTVAMVDVDHFKRFNDRHGHEVGDQVLAMVGSRLAGAGGGGRAFRYGGEEFTLLFPGRSLPQVRPVLDSLRRGISRQRFTVRAGGRPQRRPGRPAPSKGQAQLAVTVSIGVAERNDQLRSPPEVLAAADRALYKAKRAGRDCIRTQTRGERR